MNTNATPKQQEEISHGLETVIVTRVKEIVDDFKVRRVLPSAKRRMVGPFIFLDQMGPEVLRVNRGLDVALRALESSPVRMMILGGEPMDGPRHIWWNFVSSSKERIEQAKEDWTLGRFAPVPEETEFIPLPDSGPAVVRYP